MNYKIKKIFNINDMNIHNHFDIELIEQKNPLFVDVKVKFRKDNLEYLINCKEDDLLANNQFSLKENLIIVDKLLDLEALKYKYDFSLEPNNILVEENLNPKILVRDLINKNENNISFIDKIVALLATLVNPKYSYEDYLQGGKDLLLKNQITKKFLDCDSCEDIKKIIKEQINEQNNLIKNKFTLIPKKRLHFFKSICLLFLLLIIVLSGVGIWQTYRLQNEKLYNQIQSAYINKQYVQTFEILGNKKVDSIPNEILLILAESSINLQPINEINKNKLLNSLSLENTELSKYWIYIEQDKFKEAEDIAYNLNNKDFLIFAYLKEIDYINQSDKTIEEKQEEVNKLEGKLKELGYEGKGDQND